MKSKFSAVKVKSPTADDRIRGAKEKGKKRSNRKKKKNVCIHSFCDVSVRMFL